MVNKTKDTSKKIVENETIKKKGNAQKSKQNKKIIVSILIVLIVILVVIIGYIIYETSLIKPNSNTSNNTYIQDDNQIHTLITQPNYLTITSHKQIKLILNLVVENNSSEEIKIKKVVLNSLETTSGSTVPASASISIGVTYIKSIPGTKYFYDKDESYFVIEVNGEEMIEYFEEDLEGIII